VKQSSGITDVEGKGLGTDEGSPFPCLMCTPYIYIYTYTRWFKYDRDYMCVNKSQFVQVIFEPPCIYIPPPPQLATGLSRPLEIRRFRLRKCARHIPCYIVHKTRPTEGHGTINFLPALSRIYIMTRVQRLSKIYETPQDSTRQKGCMKPIPY
jgi:hypothetical protein